MVVLARLSDQVTPPRVGKQRRKWGGTPLGELVDGLGEEGEGQREAVAAEVAEV